jgi:hypothetical protein
MTQERWQEPDPALMTGGAIEQPAGAIEQPAGAIEQPAGAIEQPAGAIEQPAGAIEQPAGAIEQPTEEPGTIIDRLGSHLLRIAGVEGLGMTKGPTGDDAIVVFVRDASVASSIAPELGGMRIIVEVTGPIDAQALP